MYGDYKESCYQSSSSVLLLLHDVLSLREIFSDEVLEHKHAHEI